MSQTPPELAFVDSVWIGETASAVVESRLVELAFVDSDLWTPDGLAACGFDGSAEGGEDGGDGVDVL